MNTISRSLISPPLIALQLLLCWPILVYCSFESFGWKSGLLEIVAIPFLAFKLLAIWPYLVLVSIVDWIEF